MTRRLISSGSQFEQDIGYSRAVVDGEWVFVSGTTGFDYDSMSISDSLLEQANKHLKIFSRPCAKPARTFGCGASHHILPKAEHFPDCWPVLRNTSVPCVLPRP